MNAWRAICSPLGLTALLTACGAPPAPSTLGEAAPPNLAAQGDAGSPIADAAPAGDSSSPEASPPDAGPARDAGPPPVPVCDPTSTWSPVGRIASVPATGFGRF